jgi:hypothetical protein
MIQRGKKNTAVSWLRQLHHPRTMEDQVQSEAIPCWTCGGKSGTTISFSLSTLVIPVSVFHQGSILLFVLLCCCVILTVDSVFQ